MRGRGFVRGILISLGTFFVSLGVIGIFLPVLPTTPFLLLAAACYARSSEKFYNGLMDNRVFGNYIRNYREGNGIPIKVKIISIVFLWSTISFSVVIVVSDASIRFILIAIAIAVTLHIATIRNRRKKGM